MICEADFAEVFPWMAKLERRSEPDARPSASEACIARWEDEGGTVLDNPQPARPRTQTYGPPRLQRAIR